MKKIRRESKGKVSWLRLYSSLQDQSERRNIFIYECEITFLRDQTPKYARQKSLEKN